MKTNITLNHYDKTDGKIRLITILAVLSAVSIVVGKFLQIPVGDSIRISFENLPVIFAGIVFGPFAGMTVGIVADLVGCVAVGFTINPVITFGAAMTGAVSGVVSRLTVRDGKYTLWKIVLAVLLAHCTGSIFIKSVGLRLWYTTPWSVLALRIPIYLTNTAVESLIIGVLLRSSAVKTALRRFNGSDRKD